MTCAPSEDSDQPGHPPNLISLHCALNRKLRVQCFFMRTGKTQIRLGGCPGWSESSLGAQVILLVLSCCGSYYETQRNRSNVILFQYSMIRTRLAPVVFFFFFFLLLLLLLLFSVYIIIYKMSHAMRTPVFAICEQQKRRSACASAQSDQRLCCSLSGWYNTSSFYTQNFKASS